MKAIQSDDTPIDRTWWVDQAVEQFEEQMHKAQYEEVIAQATSKALIYKFNHKRGMSKAMKRKMILELLDEYGLTPSHREDR